MGVRDSIYRLTGGYAPTGAISLEVVRRSSDPGDELLAKLGEHFFVVGPGRIERGYNFLVSTQATFGGAQVVDFGMGPGSLTLSGTIAALHAGPVLAPSNILTSNKKGGIDVEASTKNAQGAIRGVAGSVSGFDHKSGYHDFFDLLWVLADSRGSQARARRPESHSSSDQRVSGAYHMYERLKKEQLLPFDLENCALILNLFDSNERLEVAFRGRDALRIAQDSEDPLAWQWSLSLDVVRDLSGAQPSLRPILPPVQNTLANIIGALDELNFTVQSGLNVLADVASLVESAKNFRSELNTSLKAFKSNSAASIARIRRAGAGLRKDGNDILELLLNYYLPNVDLETNYTASGADNTDLATDPLNVAGQRIAQILAQTELAMMIEQSKSISGSARWIGVPPGVETWEDLALSLYEDVSRARDLRALNPTAAGQLPTDLVGQKIKVPGANQSGLLDSIFVAHRDSRDPEQVERQLFGEDLAFDDDGDILAGPSGDLGIVSGLDCLIENCLDRMAHPRGSVPMHPAWGAGAIPGQLPDEFLGRYAPARQLDNLYQDPGVQEAELLELAIDADQVTTRIRVRPIGEVQTFTITSPKARIRGAY